MKVRLSVLIPLLLILSSLVSSTLLFWDEIRVARQNIEQEGFNDINVTLTHLQNMLDTQLAAGNFEDAKLSLAVSALHPGIKTLLFADDRDAVMLAHRFLWVGNRAVQVSAYDEETAQQVRRTRANSVSIDGQRSLLRGYYPVTLRIRSGGSGADRVGVLFAEYDLAPQLARSRYSAVIHALTYGSMMIAVVIVVAVLLHLLVSRRVRKIVAVSERFAAGDLDARVRLRGRDELAELGHAFDHMASQRRRSEEELRQYKDHLEEEVQQRTTELVLARNAAEAANQAKSAFLASMSHELRTPLNAILGFSGMMRKDPLLPDSQRQNLDIINRSGEHLLALINDVLEMAKIEAGRVQLEDAPFDLGGMVRDVTDMMRLRAEEKGLQLTIGQSSRFPRYIVGDEARLRQVLINLLGNAVKFTQEGGVTLRLGTMENRISHLLLEIEDTGPGIAPEDRQRIFEPFVQLGDQGGSKGTGLGLTITRQFVQLMGGHVGVESVPGKGSLFRIDLPLKEAAEADIAKPGLVEKGEVVGLVPGQPEYRILIVEDQMDNQLLLARLMESAGFQTRVADNGELGVQLFQSWHPHFIWMDRRMPVMDGVEATRRIRELSGGREVKIAAVTASAFQEERNEMLNAGMDDFVRKPFRTSEIYECLSRQLGVKYTYKKLPEAEVQPVILTAEMLSVLPPGLRRELRDALESLEGERIAAVIRQAAAHDSKLHKTLSRLAENFDYPAILKALERTDW